MSRAPQIVYQVTIQSALTIVVLHDYWIVTKMLCFFFFLIVYRVCTGTNESNAVCLCESRSDCAQYTHKSVLLLKRRRVFVKRIENRPILSRLARRLLFRQD